MLKVKTKVFLLLAAAAVHAGHSFAALLQRAVRPGEALRADALVSIRQVEAASEAAVHVVAVVNCFARRTRGSFGARATAAAGFFVADSRREAEGGPIVAQHHVAEASDLVVDEARARVAVAVVKEESVS